MTSTNPDLNRIVRTPCGEDIHLGGLKELLKGLWGISSLTPPETRLVEGAQPMGPDALEALVVDELGGVAAHPPIKVDSNVVSIFKNK